MVTNCRWLSHVKEALNAACLAAQCLEKEDAPVMVVEQVISWDIVDWGLLEAFGNSIDVVYKGGQGHGSPYHFPRTHHPGS